MSTPRPYKPQIEAWTSDQGPATNLKISAEGFIDVITTKLISSPTWVEEEKIC